MTGENSHQLINKSEITQNNTTIPPKAAQSLQTAIKRKISKHVQHIRKAAP